MIDMQLITSHNLKEPQLDFSEAEALFSKDIYTWIDLYNERTNPEKHYLRISPTKVFWSRKSTRYVCTADLMLKATATSTPHDGDKVLQAGAVTFSCEWPNG